MKYRISMYAVRKKYQRKADTELYSVYNSESAVENNPTTIGLAGFCVAGLSREY